MKNRYIKKLQKRLKIFGGKWLLKFLYNTCRWEISGYEKVKQLLDEGTSVIVVTWHGRLLPVFMHLSGKQHYGLAGTHRDADFIAQIGIKLGWQLLRGSSKERGKEALIEIVRALKNPGTLVALTPDGPKGPAKIPKPGAIRAAQKSGSVIIPVAGVSTREWGFENWDVFYVSKPFSKMYLNYGDPITIEKSDDFETSVEIVKNSLDNILSETKQNIV